MRKVRVTKRKNLIKENKKDPRDSEGPPNINSPRDHDAAPAMPAMITIQFSMARGNIKSFPTRVFRVIIGLLAPRSCF
jgi:hypothetical protein